MNKNELKKFVRLSAREKEIINQFYLEMDRLFIEFKDKEFTLLNDTKLGIAYSKTINKIRELAPDAADLFDDDTIKVKKPLEVIDTSKLKEVVDASKLEIRKKK